MVVQALLAFGTAVLAILIALRNPPSPATGYTSPGSGSFFDTVASRYDLLNRIISLGLDTEWRRSAVDAALPAASVLDVSTGTGSLALAVAQRSPRTRVVGIDPSRDMLALGHVKVAAGGKQFEKVHLQEAVAENLPFEDESFDAVVVAFGVRNFQHRDKGIGEMIRVLKVGGRLVILELSTPAGKGVKDTVARLFINKAMPKIASFVSGNPSAYQYLSESMAKFPTPERFVEILRKRGLTMKAHRRLSPFGLGPDLYTAVKSSQSGR